MPVYIYQAADGRSLRFAADSDFWITDMSGDDGLDIETLYSILGPVFASGRVRSMDVVEYNPLLDAGGGDLCRLREIFSHISALLK